MRKLQLIAENINEHLTTLNTIKDKDLKNILKFYNIILASIKKKVQSFGVVTVVVHLIVNIWQQN